MRLKILLVQAQTKFFLLKVLYIPEICCTFAAEFEFTNSIE